jgi:hypothetical protein
MPRVGPGATPQPPKKKPAPAPKGSAPSPTGRPAPSTGLKIGETSTVQIPQQYQQLVYDTAKNTGLPVSIIAAQITVESDWNPNAESPAGARGIAQFLPSTWNSEGCAGSWWSPYYSFVCYTKLMRQLIAEFNGNLRNVLAAYNAGPGNLAAGYGYADEIIAMAGGGAAVSAGGVAVGTIQLPSLPSTNGDSWASAINAAHASVVNTARTLAGHTSSVTQSGRARQEYTNG